MFSTKSNRVVSYIVMGYIIVAIGWWAVLLHREHEDLYDAYEVIRSQDVRSDDTKLESVRMMDRESFLQKRKRKSIMIISEAIFIGLGLLIGLWYIHKSYTNLVRTEKVKQNFLLAISHELKSPIASVRLALESLLRFNKSDPKSNEIATQGLKETNRLHTLVKNILLATRLDAGYLPDYQQVDISRSLTTLCSTLTTQYPGCKIRTEVQPQKLNIELDRQAFEIICLNLLENALKYSASKLDIFIKVWTIGNSITIRVEDQGIGIPVEEREQIFKRFYRIGDESRRATKGTGLGLYIVHTLVTRKNGKIKIESNEPSGTIFTVAWPLRRKA